MFGLITPKQGLSIVRKQLEKELNDFWRHALKAEYKFIPVNEFMLVVDNIKKEVYFVVNSTRYPYHQGDMLRKAVNTMLESKLRSKNIVERVVVNYSDAGSSVIAGYTDETGQKLKKQIEL